jgi:hypothetical protein
LLMTLDEGTLVAKGFTKEEARAWWFPFWSSETFIGRDSTASIHVTQRRWNVCRGRGIH